MTCFELCLRAINIGAPEATLEVTDFVNGSVDPILEVACFARPENRTNVDVAGFLRLYNSRNLSQGSEVRSI